LEVKQYRVRVLAVQVGHRLGKAVHDNVDFWNDRKDGLGDAVGRADDDLVDVLAREHAEDALAQVHDRVVGPFHLVDDLVVMDANNNKVALLLDALEERRVSNVFLWKKGNLSITGYRATTMASSVRKRSKPPSQ